MDRSFGSWFSTRRRRLLGALGLAAGGWLPGRVFAQSEDDDPSFVVEQGDRCVPVTPLRGDDPVEDAYDYTYPVQFDGPPGSSGPTFSSEGMTDLQRDRTSVLFLYDGPNGLSLVFVHGHLDGDRDAGGTITFTVSGLPDDGTWLVRDDYYRADDGERAESNYDRWDVDGSVHTVDWAYRGARTDGGAFRGLGTDLDVRIEPAFNDEARLTDDHDYGPIEDWEVLSGDRGDPDRHALRLDQPVVIRSGSCESADHGDQQTSVGEDGTTRENRKERGRTKHETKQEKHRKKHEKKQRKHEKKHERKQRKHRKKHEKKQRKHEKKHERKQRKHRKKHERKQRKHERKRKKHD